MMDGRRSMLSGLALGFLIVVITTITLVPGANSISLRTLAPSTSAILAVPRGDRLNVKVSHLTSPKTTSLFYDDFYSLRYCKPPNIITTYDNFIQFLQGKTHHNSVYNFYMRVDQACKVACRIILSAEDAMNFKKKIRDDYRVNMFLGNVAVKQGQAEGFRVGFMGTDGRGEAVYFIHNHLSFRVMYRNDPQTDSNQIVGFEVDPYSITHEYEGPWNERSPGPYSYDKLLTCNQTGRGTIRDFMNPQRVENSTEIIFTYDVSFYKDDGKPRIWKAWHGPDMIY